MVAWGGDSSKNYLIQLVCKDHQGAALAEVPSRPMSFWQLQGSALKCPSAAAPASHRFEPLLCELRIQSWMAVRLGEALLHDHRALQESASPHPLANNGRGSGDLRSCSGNKCCIHPVR